MENCQIRVFLTYAGPHGHVMLDRGALSPQRMDQRRSALQGPKYLPSASLLTQPQLAQQMLKGAFDPASRPPG